MRVADDKHFNYDFNKSVERIDSILTSGVFFEKSGIPNSECLTYTNGYYIDCYAIFIDIRNSSKLPSKYRRDVLAKIYRAYISEITAIFQSCDSCKEVNIAGDCVWGIFEAQKKEDVNNVFRAAYTSNSMVNIMNYKLLKKLENDEYIKIGIGIAKGRALMVKAGYSGSGLNDTIYMGEVVNHASNLCSNGNKNNIQTIVISDTVFKDLAGYNGHLNKPYQSMFDKFTDHDNIYYHGNIIRVDMDEWLSLQRGY